MLRIPVFLLAVVAPLAAQFSIPQVSKIMPPGIDPNDRFGQSLAASGNTMVAGAPGDDDQGTDAGAAYVYVRGASGWTLQQKLLPSDAAPDVQGFADRVAIDGNTIAVATTASQAVWVFVRSGTTWTQQAKFSGDDTVAGDNFGHSLSLSGDRIAVGANADDGSKGAVYTFERTGTNWTQTAKVLPINIGPLDRFGQCVAIEGDTLAAGAFADDDGGVIDSGSIFVFEWNGSSWGQAVFHGRGDTRDDWLGVGCSLSGDTLVVGAMLDDADCGGGSLNASGTVWVFRHGASGWEFEAKVAPDDVEPNDNVGISGLHVEGDTLVVGSRYDDDADLDDPNADSGAVYVFERSGSNWTQTAKMVGSDTAVGDHLGLAAALAGAEVVAGAYRHDGAGLDAGAVYVFDPTVENDDCRLVGWWKADGDATDASGFGNDGILHFDATYAPGLDGQAFSFDGNQDHVRVADDRSLVFRCNEGFTIDCWVNPNSLRVGPWHNPIVQRSSGSNGEGRWALDNVGHHFTGELLFLLYNQQGQSSRLFSNTPLQVGVWTHIAVVRDGAVGYLYLNGVLDASAPLTTDSTESANPRILHIGSGVDDRNSTGTQTNWGFDGLIDSVGIFRKAFSAAEIQDLYSRGPADKCPGGDRDAPIVTITAPADGAITNQTSIAVAANVTDASTTTVSSTPAGVSGSLPAGGGTANGTVSLVVEGPGSITVSAVDASGNVGGNAVTVIRDTIDPGVVVVSPADGAVFGASPITVTVDVTDATATSVQIGAGTFPIASGSGQVSGSVTITEGGNAIPITVTDAAGNVTSDSVTVVLDLTAPIVTIDTPANGACFGPGEAIIGVSATVDDLTATTVGSTPAGVSGALPAGGGTVSGTVTLVEGSNAITVGATDAASLIGSGAVTVILDTTAPSVAITSPADGDAVAGAIDVDADVIEPAPGSGIASVVFAVDGSPVATLTAPPWGIVYDTAPLGDGTHAVAITATDGKGNSSSASVSVEVDNTAPVVTIANPVDGAVVAGTMPLDVVASDSGSGLVGVSVEADGAAPSGDPSAIFAPPQSSATVSGSDDTTAHADGPLGVSASAVDAAGNAAQDSVTVTVDNTAPQKALIAPLDGETVSGTLQITAEASDANLDSLEIFVDGVSIVSSSISPLSASIDTTLRLDGAMTVTVVVRDLAGNESTCSAGVTVDNIGGRMIPKQLNLKAKKAKGDVKAELEGANLALLLPTEAHGIQLRIPGGSPVPSVQGWGGDDTVENGKLKIRFDRQAVVNALCAGVAGGAIAPNSVVPVDVIADGVLIETVLVTIKN